jgi:hypothetical protein
VVPGGVYREEYLDFQDAEQDSKLGALRAHKSETGVQGFAQQLKSWMYRKRFMIRRAIWQRAKFESVDEVADSAIARLEGQPINPELNLIKTEDRRAAQATDLIKKEAIRKLLSVLSTKQRKIVLARLLVVEAQSGLDFARSIEDPGANAPHQAVAEQFGLPTENAANLQYSRALKVIRSKGFPLLTPEEREALEEGKRTR